MPPKKILVVDDDPLIARLIAVVLQGEGHAVRIASNGVAALKIISQDMPDLVVLDVNMPEMDGWHVLAALRGAPGTKNLPVLMCTNNDLVGDVERAELLGSQGYVTKPFQIDRLIEKVHEILSRGPGG